MIRPDTLLDKQQLKQLRRVRAWRSWWTLAATWGQIAAAFALVIAYPYWYVYLPAIVVVGRNQFALSVMVHEAAHHLLFKSLRWNNPVAEWLCAFPIMIELKAYRHYHLQHHAHTQREKDPDLVLSRPFPVTRASFMRKMLRDFTGIAGVRRYYGTFRSAMGSAERPWYKRLGRIFVKLHGFFITNTVIFLILLGLGQPELYLLLWWVPMLTWYSFIYRIRNIAEHAGTGDPEDDFRNTRTTLPNFLAGWAVAPLKVNYHLEHHLFPLAPWYNLKRAHQMLLQAGYGDRMLTANSYSSVLRSVVV